MVYTWTTDAPGEKIACTEGLKIKSNSKIFMTAKTYFVCHILAVIHLVPNIYGPWTFGPSGLMVSNQFSLHGQMVPNQFGSHGHMVPRIFSL